jgi:hypothetical protein
VVAGGLDSDKQAETCQIFSYAEISRSGRVWQYVKDTFKNKYVKYFPGKLLHMARTTNRVGGISTPEQNV